MPPDRRSFLTLVPAAALIPAATLLGGAAPSPAAAAGPDANATEDLMREHGILRRLLILMEHLTIGSGSAPPPMASDAKPMIAALHIVDRFVHGYHEKLEEEQVFPVLQKRGIQAATVKVLLDQHQAGRKVTASALQLLDPKGVKPEAVPQVQQLMASFARMYQPHAAREDTEVFPAFHALYTEKQFDEISDKFEGLERKLLSGGSFESVLAEVQDLERAAGISDLAIFTPR